MANSSLKNNTKNNPKGYQFGTFKGVFTPSILTILGVIMYLRFGWALGNIGLFPSLLVLTLASTVTFLTGLSLSSLATNMRIEGGGAYFIISRSLGIEAGAAVGLPLFVAQALGISFYIAGFSEALIAVFPNIIPNLTAWAGISMIDPATASSLAHKFVGCITLLVLTVMAYKSADLALKSQFIIMAVIFASLISFFAGGSAHDLVMPTAVSLNAKKTFWPVFAVIFPAVTGIEAGIAMSGDLKNSAKSLPLGTICSVLLGYFIYIAIAIFLWHTVSNKDLFLSNPMIMTRIAKYGVFIIMGIWAASLSSAIGALLGAPRTLQALARDHVIPQIFGKGFGKNNDPRIATLTAFLVGMLGILLGSLNVIAPILSMFFLTSYGLLNVSAGLEELTDPPSWRPKFRVPWAISFTGAFICFAVMFMINAGATFIAAFVSISVYILMERRSLKARWGDMRSGILMLTARFSILALVKRKPEERTWKPNILVLSGTPTNRWYLIELANAISQDKGFLTVAAILPENTDRPHLNNISKTITEYLHKRKVLALVKTYPAKTPLRGAEALVKAYGYGPITPNTILIGETERPENYMQFAKLVQTINHQQQNLVIVRENADIKDDNGLINIDIWWYGSQQNLGLMLALGYLITRSDHWRKAELTLKSIVNKPEEKDETLKHLQSFINNIRINAKAEVLIKESTNIFTDIRKHSRNADLIFAGMRPPMPDENLQKYSLYYENLLNQTEGLPPTALVLAAEEIDFFAIFEES